MKRQFTLLLFILSLTSSFADEICNSKFYKEKYALIRAGRMEITDVATEDLRPYSRYESFKMILPGRSEESIISVYGYPLSEKSGFIFNRKGKDYILYKELVDSQRNAVLEYDTPLEKMDFDYFFQYAFKDFDKNHLVVDELVMLPDAMISSRGDELIYQPYRVRKKDNEYLYVEVKGERKLRKLKIRDVFLSNVSMIKDYSFLQSFYEFGGEGKIIRYKTDFSQLNDKELGYDIISDHRAEIHYIAPTKLPESNAIFGIGQKIFSNKDAKESAQKLLDQNIPFYIVSRSNEWKGVALHSNSRLNRELQRLSGLPEHETVLFFDQTVDLVTVEHEVKHLNDKKIGLRSDIKSFINLNKLDNDFHQVLKMFILEYRAYQVGFDIYLKQGTLALAESYKSVFSKHYATPLLEKMDKLSAEQQKSIFEFLPRFCDEGDTFNLDEVLSLSKKLEEHNAGDISKVIAKKIRAKKMSRNSLVDDAYTIQGRYYTHFNRFNVKLNGNDKDSIIRVYSKPEKVGKKEFVNFYEESNHEGVDVLNTMEPLKQIPYEDFRAQVQPNFEEEYIDLESLVFMPESILKKGGAEKVILPVRVKSIEEDIYKVVIDGDEKLIQLDKKDVFYHNYTLLKDYEFLRSFYENGGEGDLVFYVSDDDKFLEHQEFITHTGHMVEKPYIRIKKLPSKNDGFMKTPELFEELGVLVGNTIEVFVTPENKVWHGYAPGPENVLNMYLTDALKLNQDRAIVIVAENAPFGTISHELKHAIDYNGGNRDNFNDELLHALGEYRETEDIIYYVNFYSEYRAYQTGYLVTLERMGQEKANWHLNQFLEFHGKKINSAIESISNGDQVLKDNLLDLLRRNCLDEEGFTLEGIYSLAN